MSTNLAKLSIIAGTAIAALTTAVTLRVVRSQARDEEWVATSLEVRASVAQLVGDIRGAGSGIRVYLLTHNDAYLDSYHSAKSTLPAELAALAAATADHPDEAAHVDRLRTLVDARMQRIADALAGAEQTADWLDQSKRVMDQIAGECAAIDRGEAMLLADRRDAARASERDAILIVTLGLVVSLILVAAGWTLQRVALGRETRLLRLLNIGSRVANDSPSFQAAMKACLDQICAATGWDAAHAHVLSGGQLVSSGLWHVPDDRFRAFQDVVAGARFEPGTGIAGSLMTTARANSYADLRDWDADAKGMPRKHAAVTDAAIAAGLRGILALPVVAGDRVRAVLEFFTVRPAHADPGLLDVLTVIGVQLGRLLEREEASELVERKSTEMAALSIRDELTGLLNRRGFVALGSQQIRTCARTAEPCSLLFMDMDGLKQINDDLGHAAGDSALQDVAAVLKRSFRDADVLARLGGDEFVALASGATRDHTIEDRIMQNLRGHFAGENPNYPLVLSVGVTVVEPRSDVELEDLLRLADRAMYASKRARRGG